MLTRTFAVVTIAIVPSIAIAQQAPVARPAGPLAGYIPTGIDVRGHTAYVIDGNNRVVQVDCSKIAAHRSAEQRAACYRVQSESGEAVPATE